VLELLDKQFSRYTFLVLILLVGKKSVNGRPAIMTKSTISII